MGSTFYVGQLSDEQIAQHEMYLNFDMVGSPNYGFFILRRRRFRLRPRGT